MTRNGDSELRSRFFLYQAIVSPINRVQSNLLLSHSPTTPARH
ncbi:hypothetical protein ACWATR_21220 [Nostoc sp. UIC 10890]